MTFGRLVWDSGQDFHEAGASGPTWGASMGGVTPCMAFFWRSWSRRGDEGNREEEEFCVGGWLGRRAES